MLNSHDVPPIPLLTVIDVAKWLRRNPSTIRKWVCYRRIPYLKVGRSVCFDRADILRWLEIQNPQRRKWESYNAVR
jgi:excisionase family DNA binding protein